MIALDQYSILALRSRSQTSRPVGKLADMTSRYPVAFLSTGLSAWIQPIGSGTT